MICGADSEAAVQPVSFQEQDRPETDEGSLPKCLSSRDRVMCSVRYIIWRINNWAQARSSHFMTYLDFHISRAFDFSAWCYCKDLLSTQAGTDDLERASSGLLTTTNSLNLLANGRCYLFGCCLSSEISSHDTRLAHIFNSIKQ